MSCMQRLEEDVRSLSAEVAGSCMPSDTGSRNPAQALCKNNTRALNHWAISSGPGFQVLSII